MDSTPPRPPLPHPAVRDPKWIRTILMIVGLGFLLIFLLVPLISVFYEAFRSGVGEYGKAITSADAVSAIWLTLAVAAIAVPCNLVFGIAASWSIAKFSFPGRSLLITLLDLPFAVSPVICGLALVLLLGDRGLLGPFLQSMGWKIIFAPPGIVLATIFVTFPFVARELIPLMEAQGSDEELAALSLGANGWQTFLRITLPKIRWGLLYGVILCNARAMGEFGAVSVVSGLVRGRLNTIPLQVKIFFDDYGHQVGSFALASLLSLLGVATLAIKAFLEWQMRRATRSIRT